MIMFEKQQKLYGCEAVEKLINLYIEKGGEITEVEEGSLGYGFMILHGEELKTAIIKEVYINCWSSGYTIRLYNKTPKKYKEIIDRSEICQEVK